MVVVGVDVFCAFLTFTSIFTFTFTSVRCALREPESTFLLYLPVTLRAHIPVHVTHNIHEISTSQSKARSYRLGTIQVEARW